MFDYRAYGPESGFGRNDRGATQLKPEFFAWLLFAVYLFIMLRHAHTQNGFLNITVSVKYYIIMKASTQTGEK